MPGPYPLVDRDDISGTAPNPDSATARAGFGALWDAFSYLLFSGDNSGTKAQARTALEVYSSTTVDSALALMPTTVEMDAAIADAVAYVAGDALQVVTNFSTGLAVGSNTMTTAATSSAITPRSNASKLLIEASFQAIVSEAGNMRGEFAIYESGTAIQMMSFKPITGGGMSQIPLHLVGIVTNSATTARTFTLKIRNPVNTNSVEAYDVVFKITEIKT